MAGHPKHIEPVIRFQNVFKTYLSNGASVHALNGVTLEAAAGEFVALMGRSGCGKSTLLNLAGAMDQPTEGRVLIEGLDTTSLDDAGLTRLRRSQVGFVFQSFQLLQNLSAIENVELPLLLARAAGARENAKAQLARVELAGLENRLPHQLSGGQMQRVAIARAMVHSPRILLADEPTGNLDTATGDVVLRILREIASSGVLVLMATHSRESAALCDRIVHMRDGRIEA